MTIFGSYYIIPVHILFRCPHYLWRRDVIFGSKLNSFENQSKNTDSNRLMSIIVETYKAVKIKDKEGTKRHRRVYF